MSLVEQQKHWNILESPTPRVTFWNAGRENPSCGAAKSKLKKKEQISDAKKVCKTTGRRRRRHGY